ncbi:MAG: PDDEXK nuclease domain-containing protein [Marinilabiliaceae bacterium]|nr:PDDEXK nuclease domain-containing protein [Marinilabiliaceae bacterium]
MKNIVITDKDYKQWVSEVRGRYRQSQIKAAVKVNSEMLQFYWLLGHDIVERQMENTYGSGFFKRLSADLQRELPDAKGFSPTNIKYIKYFYELYSPMLENRQQVVDDFALQNLPQLAEDLFCIPWGHHVQIIDKCKGNPQKALFFVHKTKENNWSRAVLLNFLDTDLYEREGKAITNFKATLPALDSDLAQQMTKDPYCFDFLTLSQQYSEKELKDALMDNIQKFLLELGNGFAFVGKEVRIEVGETEKFIDMLFYNIRLHCYVVLEVKVEKFDFSNVGQLGGYMVAVNHQLKGEGDNPTIGLLVCKYKDSVEAQYALESSTQPIGVSAYQLSKLLPEQFKSSLPSIEELENVLEGK